MEKTEEEKIYDLLQSRNKENITLALELAKGLEINLTEYWDDLKNYYEHVYGYNETHQSVLNRLFNERSIYINGYLLKKNDYLRFLKWVVNTTRVSLSRIELEELPEYIASNHIIQELDLSKNHLSTLPASLAWSNIQKLNVSYNPKLDFKQLWDIVLQMPKLEQVIWLNNASISFDKNKKMTFGYGYLGLQIPYHPQYIHHPDKLISTFKHFPDLTGLVIDLRAQPIVNYGTLRLPPTPEGEEWNCFPTHFFDDLNSLQRIIFHGKEWNWKHTFSLLSKLSVLNTIEVQVSNFIKISIVLKTGKITIFYNSTHKSRKKTEDAYPYLLQILEAALIYKDKITRIQIPATIHFPALPQAIGHFSSLQELLLPKLKLEKIFSDWSNLNELTELDLSYNPAINWEELLPKIALLPKLKNIKLSHNQIKQLLITKHSWEQLSYLDISNNQLKEIPNWVQTLPNLSVLKINNNHIKQLPSWLNQLPIKQLILSNNKLESIEAEVLKFPPLEVLYLDSNKIEALPSTIYKLPKLHTLFLANNPLKTIAPDLANITSLVQLTANACQLEELPMSMAKMVELQRLFLAENNFEAIPKAISTLPKLQKLGLATNQIKHTDIVLQLPNLQSINLNSNQLKLLPNGIEHCENLHTIKAGNNPLEMLPTMKNITKLNSINFDYTNIKTLENIHLNNYMNISLRGIYDFKWAALNTALQGTKQTKVFWLKNRRFDTEKKLHIDFKNQAITNWKPILEYIKTLHIRPSLLLQGNDIQYLGEEWSDCHFINELYLEDNPNFDVKKSLPVFATMKGLRILYLDDKKKWWRKKLQTALGSKTSIRFKK